MFPIVVERGSSKHRTHMMILMAIILVILIAVAFILPEYQVGRVNRMWAMAIAIMGLNLVLGYGGLFALGHSAFIGLGAFRDRVAGARPSFRLLDGNPVLDGGMFRFRLAAGVTGAAN